MKADQVKIQIDGQPDAYETSIGMNGKGNADSIAKSHREKTGTKAKVCSNVGRGWVVFCSKTGAIIAKVIAA